MNSMWEFSRQKVEFFDGSIATHENRLDSWIKLVTSPEHVPVTANRSLLSSASAYAIGRSIADWTEYRRAMKGISGRRSKTSVTPNSNENVHHENICVIELRQFLWLCFSRRLVETLQSSVLLPWWNRDILMQQFTLQNRRQTFFVHRSKRRSIKPMTAKEFTRLGYWRNIFVIVFWNFWVIHAKTYRCTH